MMRAFALAPRRLPRAEVARLAAAQPCFNKLYDALARDVDFLAGALADYCTECAWNSTELATLRRVAAHQASKPRLLLPNSVYLEGCIAGRASSERSIVLTVGNVQVSCTK